MDPGVEWPHSIEGSVLRFRKGRHDEMYNCQPRLSVKCNLHDECSKSRSVALDMATFGPRSAQYFLGAWLRAGSAFPEAAAHQAFKPSRKDIRAYIGSFDVREQYIIL